MVGLAADLRFMLLSLRRRPALATVAVGLLAVAMSVVSTLVAVAGSQLLRPLAYPEGRRLGMVWARWEWGDGPVAFATLNLLRERARSLDRVEGFALRGVAVEGADGSVELLPAVAVTTGALDLLGAGVARGRPLTAADAAPGASPAMLVSWERWQRHDGGEPGAVGRVVRVGGSHCSVVGVLRRGFVYPLPAWMEARADLYLPYRSPASTAGLRTRDLFLLVRRAPGASWETVRRELASLAGERGPRLVVVPLREALLGAAAGVVRALLLAAMLVTAVAACNLALLILARTDARSGELAVRVASGASPWAAVRLVLLESVALAGAGTALGLGVAAVLDRRMAQALPAWVPRVAPVHVDGWVVRLVAGVCAAAAVAAAAPAALAVLRVSYASVIKGVGSLSGGGRWAGRLRRWLVAGEVAVAAAALAVTAAVVVSAGRLLRAPLGFRPEGVVTAMVQPVPPGPAPSVAQELELVGALGRELGPVAVASAVPLGGARSDVEVAGRHGRSVRAAVCYVSASYFDVLGVRVGLGRGFRRDEVRSGAPVAVVDRRLAQVLGLVEPVGETLALAQEYSSAAPRVQVVGVVDEVAWEGPTVPPRPTLYLPFGLVPGEAFAAVRSASPVFVATRSDLLPARVERRLRRAVAGLGWRAAVLDVARMETRVRLASERMRLLRRVVGGLALASLALACGGVYGLVAFWVVRRRRELGVRAACGATAGRIARDLVGEVTRLVGPAAVVGAAVGVAAAWRLASWVPGLDPPGVAAAGAVMMVAVAAAIVGALPGALRATRMAPAAALRYE